MNDRTVVRGGVGAIYADIISNRHMWTYGNEPIASVEVNNDGRPVSSPPFNGPRPTRRRRSPTSAT